MSRRFGILALVGALILVTADARAQGQSGNTVPDDRPATTTILGDTGLWFVPTGDVLKDKDWSVSGYRANWDVHQGFTDISHFIGTFAYGVKDRAEIFGSIRLSTRIDRDFESPVFRPTDSARGGVANDYPFVKQDWTGNHLGDTIIGVKVGLTSQARHAPVSFAIRPLVKIPTGDKASGSTTGKIDFGIDAIISGEAAKVVEVSGTVGYMKRGDPAEFDLSDGLRFGVGAQFPDPQPAEVHHRVLGREIFQRRRHHEDADRRRRRVDSTRVFVDPDAVDADVRRHVAEQEGRLCGRRRRLDGQGGQGKSRQQVRLAVPARLSPADRGDPAAATAAAAAASAGSAAYAHGGRAVQPVHGRSGPAVPGHRHRAGFDRLRDYLSVERADRHVRQRGAAEHGVDRANQVGTVPVTVTGTCATDQKSASDTVNIQVTARPVRPPITFEDVYFDFDRYSLTDAATRLLMDAVTTLRANPDLRIRIEGHTCSIGTAEYNLALGDRRARSVMQYLVSQGISADRLTTVSFGEENPKYDNSREETRRLNRRAAMTVQIVAGN